MTSTFYCATSDHREQDRLSREAAVPAATGTPSDLYRRADLQERVLVQPYGRLQQPAQQRGVPLSCTKRLSGVGIASESCWPFLTHCDLPKCPCMCLFNCSAWAAMIWYLLLKEIKQVLSTICSLPSKKPMNTVFKRSASTYSHEAKILSISKNDGLVHWKYNSDRI